MGRWPASTSRVASSSGSPSARPRTTPRRSRRASRAGTGSTFLRAPPIRELGWHLGRPLRRLRPARVQPPTAPPRDRASSHDVARCAALGEALAAAELGLPVRARRPRARSPAGRCCDGRRSGRTIPAVRCSAAAREGCVRVCSLAVPLQDVARAPAEQRACTCGARPSPAGLAPDSARARDRLRPALGDPRVGPLSSGARDARSRAPAPPQGGSRCPRGRGSRARAARRAAPTAGAAELARRARPCAPARAPAAPAPRRDVPARPPTPSQGRSRRATRGWVDGLFVGS